MDDSLSLVGEARPSRGPLARMEEDLGAALARRGIVPEQGLAEARSAAIGSGERLSTQIWLLGFATLEELRLAHAEFLKIPCADPAAIRESAAANRDLLGGRDVAEFQVLPIARRRDAVLIATAEPWRLALMDDLGEKLRQPVVPCFLDVVPLALLLEEIYGIASPERFRQTPELRTRRLVASDPVEAEHDSQSEAGEELMSETSFDRLYQR